MKAFRNPRVLLNDIREVNGTLIYQAPRMVMIHIIVCGLAIPNLRVSKRVGVGIVWVDVDPEVEESTTSASGGSWLSYSSGAAEVPWVADLSTRRQVRNEGPAEAVVSSAFLLLPMVRTIVLLQRKIYQNPTLVKSYL